MPTATDAAAPDASVVDWMVSGFWLAVITVLEPVVAVSVRPATRAIGPSPEVRAVNANVYGCIGASGVKDSAAPFDSRAKPPFAGRTGLIFPRASASNMDGTNVVASSACPAAFGWRSSHQNPFTHFPAPSSTAPSRLTLGTSHSLMRAFIRRV